MKSNGSDNAATSGAAVRICAEIAEHNRLKVVMGDNNGRTAVWLERRGARFTVLEAAEPAKAAEFRAALITLIRNHE